MDIKDDRRFPVIVELFGDAQDREASGLPSRVIVRDAFLDLRLFRELGFPDLDLEYTEGKWENAIDRISGAAKKGSLRQLERVPAGASSISRSSTMRLTTIKNRRTLKRSCRPCTSLKMITLADTAHGIWQDPFR